MTIQQLLTEMDKIEATRVEKLNEAGTNMFPPTIQAYYRLRSKIITLASPEKFVPYGKNESMTSAEDIENGVEWEHRENCSKVIGSDELKETGKPLSAAQILNAFGERL